MHFRAAAAPARRGAAEHAAELERTCAENDHRRAVDIESPAGRSERIEKQGPVPSAHELFRTPEAPRAAGREQHATDPSAALPSWLRHVCDYTQPHVEYPLRGG